MYTEEGRKRSLILDFISKLILIIIFVLLLIWLVPWPNMDSLNPLKDQIFNANLQTMKEAGITYFTTERLPVEVGDKTTLTLQKMLDMKLLIPFTDKNGNSCDVTASYVSLEKKETEYLMKVNLKCGEEEDYILVHLGCYSYCTADICEKDPNNDEKPTTKPVSTSKPTNKPTTTPTTKPTPTNKPTVKPTTTPTVTPTITPVVEKEYEYSKTTEATYSSWSNWTKYVKKKNDGVVYELTDTKEVVDLGTIYTKIGMTKPVYEYQVITQDVYKQTGTYTYKVCTDYSYVADSKTIYKVESDWVYVDAYYTGDNPPKNTMDSQWIFQGIDWEECTENCTDHSYDVYRKQTRKVTAYTEYSNITATCTNVEERAIPVYGLRPVTTTNKVLKEEAKPVYAYVRYYKVRTRNLLSEAKTVYKWSSYNDQTLLSQGYKYTGNTRTK